MKFKYYNPDINLVVNNKKLLSDLNDIKASKPGLVCGAVRMFNNGDLILDTTPNLVVGMGRQYVAQRLFERAHPAEEEIVENDEIWTWKVSHFALGNGGSTTVSDYTNLLGPDLCDQDLYNALPLSKKDTEFLTSPGDILRGINPVNMSVKQIVPSGTIDIIASDDISCMQSQIYSYVRVICTKSPGEPDYLENDDDYLHINEAGLYYVNKLKSKLRMFAHICFPAKDIEKASEFVIEWYILC